MDDKSSQQVERELALRSHERDWALQDQMFSSVIEFGQSALKGATLISGGSVVVGLAFVGSIYGTEPETAKRLLVAVVIFAIGATIGGVASGFSYLAHQPKNPKKTSKLAADSKLAERRESIYVHFYGHTGSIDARPPFFDITSPCILRRSRSALIHYAQA